MSSRSQLILITLSFINKRKCLNSMTYNIFELATCSYSVIIAITALPINMKFVENFILTRNNLVH